ncbi:NAD-dependent succinate-semialdehyde dehydrogenase [Amycolatopsis jiangsuensis]|uniref:Succinate-semialdehyde dehydrogenase/glutarate-semialdehyde dehydrogenase n=1 Tax=Amycolatopsis jiangsuensis TaxID=1181879 RepID=A0A840J6A3_9PSEU|nr:NAD-dependent succinate-semialdehyde dehydrogenase [Amycolatopsis jiangsuensis]MBB4689560.1 succinate-semialdehyde dehydrogenase/glutarate-semialdehyde dehydrogenase [Amycolatopsis jiangsuensis]
MLPSRHELRGMTMSYRSVNPFTEELLAEYPEHTDAQVEDLLAGAERAYRGDWAGRSFDDRGAVIAAVGELMAERAEELARLATTEMGKRYPEALYEVQACVAMFRYFAAESGAILTSRDLEVPDGSARLDARPLGVIFCIEPWNFPYIQLARVSVPILMAGNTVVMKHAPNVPQCALAFERLFVDAGAPEGLYTNVFLSNDQAASVIRDDRVRAVSLTGSERAGEAVGAIAASALKKVTLELGGSDPFIVLDDADLDLAVRLAVDTRTMNTGQACGGSKRFIVHTSLYQQFTERVSSEFEAMVPGDPMDPGTGVGPLVSEGALNHIREQIDLAVSHGATVLGGGCRIERKGYFIEPTLLGGVTPDNPVFGQELFAPVAMVFEVSNDEEAIALANASDYGLGCSVISADVARAERVGAAVDSGMVFINHMVDTAPNLPWGGVKRSGYGRELSHLGIGEFVNWKLVRTA